MGCGKSCSGKNGIGIDKNYYMSYMFNKTDLKTIRWVRQTFNLNNLANPGEVFSTPRTFRKTANAKLVSLRELNYIRGLYR